jgi:hypothetical protein
VLEDQQTRWRVHGEPQIYAGRWMEVSLVDVELPDGERFEHHIVRLPSAVGGSARRTAATSLASVSTARASIVRASASAFTAYRSHLSTSFRGLFGPRMEMGGIRCGPSPRPPLRRRRSTQPPATALVRRPRAEVRRYGNRADRGLRSDEIHRP